MADGAVKKPSRIQLRNRKKIMTAALEVFSQHGFSDFRDRTKHAYPKRGYCVQFSSAMTIMARTLGIPARIGVGFASGGAALAGTALLFWRPS